MFEKKIFIRQGDILFEKVSSIGGAGEPLETKTVALGELTGHHHSFQKKDQVLLYKKVNEDVPSQVAVVENGPQLTHQEHLSIQFPKGDYIIKREQSYNPFVKQIQRSMD